MPHFPKEKQRAFTLVEVLVVLLIFGVLIAMAAVITRAVTAAQKRSLTATRMAVVEAAIVQFVLQQKRLPCPADGTTAASNANAGVEGGRNAAGCTGNQQHGMLPWRALALTETDVTDGWDRRFTFRIHPTLAADGGMDMSWCDPAGTQAPATPAACSTACTSASMGNCTPPARYLFGRGLTVCNVDGCVPDDCNNSINIATASATCNPTLANAPLMHRHMIPHTGAAYVVISHGSTGGGAYTSGGVLSPTTATMDGTRELLNYANLAYDANAYYVDNDIRDVAGNTHFDDIVSRPSLLNIIAKAGLGARSH